MNDAADVKKIEEMSRTQLLTYVRDTLLDRAKRTRELEELIIKLGLATDWHSGNCADHDAICAAALALEKILAFGLDQHMRGVKINPLVDGVVDVIRSSLITEITTRAPKESGGADVAA